MAHMKNQHGLLGRGGGFPNGYVKICTTCVCIWRGGARAPGRSSWTADDIARSRVFGLHRLCPTDQDMYARPPLSARMYEHDETYCF